MLAPAAAGDHEGLVLEFNRTSGGKKGKKDRGQRERKSKRFNSWNHNWGNWKRKRRSEMCVVGGWSSQTGWLKMSKRRVGPRGGVRKREIWELKTEVKCEIMSTQQHVNNLWCMQSFGLCWAGTFGEWVGFQLEYEAATYCDKWDAPVTKRKTAGTFGGELQLKIVSTQTGMFQVS